MPKSTKAYVDKHVLLSAEIPVQTATYTVITHEYIIDTALQSLADAGFVVTEEKYRCNQGAKVAQGIYNISYGNDPDLSMIFAWTNSYDKSTRFRCAIGANVTASGASIIKKTSAWDRKHTGKALEEATETIQAIIADADSYFSELVSLKNVMKNIPISSPAHVIENKMVEFLDKSEKLKDAGEEEEAVIAMDNANHLAKSFKTAAKRGFGHIMGDLYFTKRLLTGDQASICMRESDNPTYTYGTGINSLWTAYNYILCSLKITHPKLWMDTQMSVLLHFMDEYDLTVFDEDDTVATTDPVPPVTGQGEFEDNMEEEEIDDTPEITGIPDGNPMSDTDDEANTPQLVDVTAEDDGKLVPEYEEESMHAYDLQNIPADNVAEATEAVTDEANNDNKVYLDAGDYPGASVGQFVDVDGVIYEITGETAVDGDVYYEATEYNMDEVTTTEEVVQDVVQEPVLPEAPLPEHVADMEEQEVENNADEVVPSNTDVIPPLTDFELEETVEEKTVDTSNKIFKAIAEELTDLYGEPFDTFKYELMDDQYNITLDSGESVVLSAAYIDNMVDED